MTVDCMLRYVWVEFMVIPDVARDSEKQAGFTQPRDESDQEMLSTQNELLHWSPYWEALGKALAVTSVIGVKREYMGVIQMLSSWYGLHNNGAWTPYKLYQASW